LLLGRGPARDRQVNGGADFGVGILGEKDQVRDAAAIDRPGGDFGRGGLDDVLHVFGGENVEGGPPGFALPANRIPGQVMADAQGARKFLQVGLALEPGEQAELADLLGRQVHVAFARQQIGRRHQFFLFAHDGPLRNAAP
jgi:hypothetical protein